MKTMKLLTQTSVLMLMLSLVACSSKDDSTEKTPEDTPTSPENSTVFTIPTTGGKIDYSNISIQIPSGAFSTEAKISVNKVYAGSVLNELEASDFYKVTLPATTNKALQVSVRSESASNSCLMMVRTFGRSTSLNEELEYCVPLEKESIKDNVYNATIPVLEGGDHNTDLIIGLMKNDVTKAISKTMTRNSEDMPDFTVYLPCSNHTIGIKVNYQTEYYDASKDSILKQKFIPQALLKLDSLGFRMDDDRALMPINIVEYWSSAKRTGLWGQHICSKVTKHWDCVDINGERLYNMSTQEEQDVMAKTLIHELGHYYQSDYDTRRSQWSKGMESPGPYLALKEAESVWSEHFFGADLSDMVVGNGVDFLKNGLWNYEKGQDANHGYGMAVLFHYFAQQFGDNSIISIFDDYKNKKDADVCLTEYAKRHNFNITDIEWYNEFLKRTAEGKVIEGYDMAGMDPQSIKIIESDSKVTYNNTIYRYGMALKSLYIHNGVSITGKQLELKENEKGTYTEIYRADYHMSLETGKPSTVSNIYYLGRMSKGESFIIKDSLNTLFTEKRLFFVTLQDPSVSHQLSVSSSLEFILTDPEPTLSVPDSVKFSAEEEEQYVTITSNCSDLDVVSSPSWCDASIEGRLKLKVQANTGDDQREGKVKVKASNQRGSVEKTIVVVQEKPNKFDYAGVYIKLSWNEEEGYIVPALGGRAAKCISMVNENGEFQVMSSGSDTTEPVYLNDSGIGYSYTFLTTSTWNITLTAAVRNGNLIITNGDVHQIVESKTIVKSLATQKEIKTEVKKSECRFVIGELGERTVLSTGLTKTCKYWFTYDAWKASAPTLEEFGLYVKDYKEQEINDDGTKTDKPISPYAKNFSIVVGLWKDDGMNIPAGN